jgi:hypothetical protein
MPEHHHHPGILWDEWQNVLEHDVDDCEIGPLDDKYHETCVLDHDDHAFDDHQFADPYNVHVTDAQIDRVAGR